jgi:alkyl hydroperoxide reductase subunit AhpC
MKKLGLVLLLAFNLFAAPKVGETAPEFTAVDSNGVTHNLTDFKGKTVVLEWVNFECPFVKKHYKSANMQDLQKRYTDKGVVWLSVFSSAEGKQGHLTATEANAKKEAMGSAATAMILDPKGTIGKAYAAKTTPHMFVIDGEGKVAYMGAIDDNDSANPEDAKTAKKLCSPSFRFLNVWRSS